MYAIVLTFGPTTAYADFAHRFDATLYEPKYWADIFANSGAQYVVLTSKHHEGFCNWDSRDIGTTWNWNSMDVGPRRDLVGELAAAIRDPSVVSPQTNQSIKFGVYHSLFEWFNPMMTYDKSTNLTNRTFVDSKTMPELYQLVEKYQPEVIWSDGSWGAQSDYWRAKEFLAWVATNSSVRDTVVWNDRWGDDAHCKHGSYLTCQDRYLPNHTVEHKWENCMTLDKTSWGWNRRAKYANYMTTKELVNEVVATVARNGNILINVGPAADGTISPIFVDRLLGLGQWLQVNGQAVYGSRPWKVCDQDENLNVYYTRDDELLYAFLTQWPSDNEVPLMCPDVSENTKAFLLGVKDNHRHALQVVDTNWSEDATAHSSTNQAAITIKLPNLNPDEVPCDYVWVIAMTAIRNLDGDPLLKKTSYQDDVDQQHYREK
jgi:alpha-L-fucosidase